MGMREGEFRPTHLQLIAYDALPLNLLSRKNDQLLMVHLDSYKGHLPNLVNAIMTATKGTSRRVMLYLTKQDSDDYTAVSLGVPSVMCEGKLFDLLLEAGALDITPTHFEPQKYVL